MGKGVHTRDPVGPAPLTASASTETDALPASFSLAMPALAFVMAMGTLAVSSGFALARASMSGALLLYVGGELTVAMAPVVFLIKRRSLRHGEGWGLSVCVGLASFVIVQCYSPILFRFEDEFQHLWTAQSILTTHHLYAGNPALPISPYYPGLELVTTQLSALSHLSIYASAAIVAGFAHVLMTVLVFYLGVRLGLTPRAAAIAVVVFATGFDYQFFLSYFAYETIAIPFLLGTLIATVILVKSDSVRASWGWALTAVALGASTIVSHHVTSYAMVAMLGSFLLVSIAPSRGWDNARRIAYVAVPVAGLMLIWDLAIARETVHYMAQIRGDLFGSAGGSAHPLGGPSVQVGSYVTQAHPRGAVISPTYWRLLADLGAATVALLIPVGAWTVWRHQPEWDPLLRASALMCLSYYVLVPLFLLTPGADQLVGRGQAYVLIPVGMMTAIALDSSPQRSTLSGSLSSRRRAAGRWGNLAVAGAVPLVVGGGLVGSWPPYSAKLPGPFQVAAFERSSDERTIDAGEWMARVIGTRVHVAADHRESLMFAGIGGEQAKLGTASLFESETFRAVDATIVKNLGIAYLIADYRMTQQLPAEGTYFDGDPLDGQYGKPLPREVLAKFDGIRGVNRSFDDGNIAIYDLRGSFYKG